MSSNSQQGSKSYSYIVTHIITLVQGDLIWDKSEASVTQNASRTLTCICSACVWVCVCVCVCVRAWTFELVILFLSMCKCVCLHGYRRSNWPIFYWEYICRRLTDFFFCSIHVAVFNKAWFPAGDSKLYIAEWSKEKKTGLIDSSSSILRRHFRASITGTEKNHH